MLAQNRAAIDELYGVAEYQYADAPLGYWVRASDDEVAKFKRPGGQDYRFTTDAPLESLPLTLSLNIGSGLVNPSIHAARLMMVELNSAVHNRDRDRTLRACRALVGFIRQQSNSYEDAGVSHSYALSLTSGLSEPLVIALDNDNQWLTDEDLTDIAHLIASLRPIYQPTMNITRLMAYDGLERMYDVNGRITLADSRGIFRPNFTRRVEGMVECRWLGALLGNELVGKQVGARVMFPVLMHMVGDRDDMRAEVERYIAAVERDLQTPLWELDPSESGSNIAVMKVWNASFMNKVRYFPLEYVPMDYLSALYVKRYQAYQEAVLVRLALEMYHRRHGHYPSTPAELVPTYLPTTPIDHSTGKPLLMKLDDAGKPILYGRGRDGDDAGGIPGEDAKTYREPRKDGDWIMLPASR